MSFGDFLKFKKFGSNKKIDELFGDNFNNTLIEIKKGNSYLREKFIENYIPFILKVTSNTTGKYIDTKNSDEFSISLEAFNIAIDNYDFGKNSSFFNFAEIVISRKLINYLKKNKSKKNELYFDDLSVKEQRYVENSTQYLPPDDFDDFEISTEIQNFESRLSEFNISLWELITNKPKHIDSIALCINIAKTLVSDNDLYNKLLKTKNIPRNELLKKVSVHRRTIENNRKMIIALCLILKSDLNNSKLCLKYLEKGGSKK